MKIYSNIDTDARTFEGRTQLAGKVVQWLREAGHTFTQNPAEADVFHFHSSGVFDSYRAYKMKQKYGKPCIYSLYSNAMTSLIMHPINFWIQKRYFQKTATQFLPSYSAALPLSWRRYFLDKLDVVIVPSHYLKRKLGKNSVVVPFGVDTKKFSISHEREEHTIKVGYFGHPGVFKGLNDFVNASTTFSSQIETHVFMTQRFSKVDEYIEKRNKNITVHGFIEDIAKAYQEMDIIVLPYRTQIGTVAQPLVLLEAMASGKPIVTTDFRFLREIVGDSAIIVPKFSPRHIARAVNRLARDAEKRQELREKAQQRAQTRHSNRIMREGYQKVYDSLQ